MSSGSRPGGNCTDLWAVGKDDFLDRDHSKHFDPWAWVRAIHHTDRDLDYLKGTADGSGRSSAVPSALSRDGSPGGRTRGIPAPGGICFFDAEKTLDTYPDLHRAQSETEIVTKDPAVFVLGSGWPRRNGCPHEMRAAGYDDRKTEVTLPDRRVMDGLNGESRLWTPVNCRRHEPISGVFGSTRRGGDRNSRCARRSNTPPLPGPAGDRLGPIAPLHWRRDRPVADPDAPVAQRPSPIGERFGLAENPDLDQPAEEPPRSGVSRRPSGTNRRPLP